MKKILYILLIFAALSSCAKESFGEITCVVDTEWTRDFTDMHDEFWESGSFKATIVFVSKGKFKLILDDSQKISGTFDYNHKLKTGILRANNISLPFVIHHNTLTISIGKEKYDFSRIK